MGYLDNTTVTVDAVLTNKGREVLAATGQINITKFALADDEVDYSLWNPAHSLGTNYYGAVIENMPIVEAFPDETQMMKYKLVTLPRTATGIPVISIQGGPVTFTNLSQRVTLTATVSRLSNANSTLGYTAILSDNSVATIEVASNSVLPTSTQSTPLGVGSVTTTGNSVSVVGAGSFVVKPRGITGTKTAIVTIIGNETGGFATTTITVSGTITDTNNSSVVPAGS